MIGRAVAASLLAAAASPTTPLVAQDRPLATANECGDFLEAMGRKPPMLRYEACVYESERQARPLRATYRVSGLHAETVEAYFVRTIRLERLKFICCYWGAPEERLFDGRGREYTLSMASPDTVHNTRAAWRDIRAFTITVHTYTEEI